MNETVKDASIAVVIPSYKVREHILGVISRIGPIVNLIVVVDDCCPQDSGAYVEQQAKDERVVVVRHSKNQGVGGAVLTGYQVAMKAGAHVIVKIDGDGQMDPELIPQFVFPILQGQADYTKGNRFFDLEGLRSMPAMRLMGNAALSFMTKLSSGYWNLFDPTNGYTAIHRDVVRFLPFEKISKRYFFETDMLFRLNTLRAVAVDVPMESKYANEVSNLKIRRILGEFLFKHVRNFLKRIFYNYYLRNMSLASIELPIGVLLLVFGGVFGIYQFLYLGSRGEVATAGTVMISAMPIILGTQLIMAFLAYDISSVPSRIIHRAK